MLICIGRLSAGTKQKARARGNKNAQLEIVEARSGERKREMDRERANRRERREAEKSKSMECAKSNVMENEGEEGDSVNSCNGADVSPVMTRKRRRTVLKEQLDSDDSSSEEEEVEEMNDDIRQGDGRGFMDEEAEEVWSSESCHDDEEEREELSESGESGDEVGFIVEECSELSCNGNDNTMQNDSESGDGSDDGDSDSSIAGDMGEGDDGEIGDGSSGGSETSDNGATSESGDDESSIECDDSEPEHNEAVPSHLRWKEGLELRAREAYQRRQTGSKYLHKLIYSNNNNITPVMEDGEDGMEIGDLFHVAKREQLSILHNEDTSITTHLLTRDWTECVTPVKMTQFITGSWGEEDAATLLRNDRDDYGDFEDLETGEKYGQGSDKEEDDRLKKKKGQKVRTCVINTLVCVCMYSCLYSSRQSLT